MTFLDLYSGVKGFLRGIKRSGHTCASHVEIDKNANNNYMAMYEIDGFGVREAIQKWKERG